MSEYEDKATTKVPAVLAKISREYGGGGRVDIFLHWVYLLLNRAPSPSPLIFIPPSLDTLCEKVVIEAINLSLPKDPE
ncbi:hypothetical protein PoB_000337000 [Plakobranchus ocellatus]|uniref:Uncharacterized protein n=1 Tax=Plakobranchus ocellatus TaxID=259542 RepID=A0AAV3Y1A9_9GAST|nr:hypothetical protein PoB_000337000 [Plakobranchus ocellatus]